jgi:putative spermidine/putrescine transport system permease protein
MERRTAPYWLTGPALLFLAAAFVLPLILTVYASLSQTEVGVVEQYRQLLTDPFYLQMIWRTVRFALVVTLISIAFGFPTAFFISRLPGRWSSLMLGLTTFPLLVNSVVRSYSWMVVLGRNGLLNDLLIALGLSQKPTMYLYTEGAVIAGLVQLFLPLMILSLYSTLSHLNPALEEASRGLGAGARETFRKVTLPLSIPGLFVGSILVFSASMTAYTTPALLGGSKVRVLATMVQYYASVSMNWPMATAIAVIMFALTLLFVLLPQALLKHRTQDL